MKYWNNWFFKYLTGNDPLKTISVFGIHFRRIIYPVLRRLDGKNVRNEKGCCKYGRTS